MDVKLEKSWKVLLKDEFDKPYFADLAKFVFVKSLVWNGTTEAKTYLANIDTTGSWMAHITEDTIFAAPFWRVEIIGTADNKAGGAGSWIKLYATAFSSR